METGKVRCIIKRPDETYGHMTNISCSLKNLQKTVEGYIETLTIGERIVIICNEEGKILKLQPNFYVGGGFWSDLIRGTAIIIGQDGDDFCDLPIDFSTWKKLLKEWGN
mgnify:CR=1 FL=1